MLANLEQLVGSGLQLIGRRAQDSVEQLSTNFANPSSYIENLSKIHQQIINAIGKKQEDALLELEQKIIQSQKLAAPNAIPEYFENAVGHKLQSSSKQFLENWEAGRFEEEKEKKGGIIFMDENFDKKLEASAGATGKKKLNLLNPQMLFQQYAIDQIFSFEKLARDIVQITKQKDSNVGEKLKQPKAPRKPKNEPSESQKEKKEGIMTTNENIGKKSEVSAEASGKKKLNLLNPQMLFQQYALDQIFSFEKLARDIVEITKQKDPNLGAKLLQPKAPRKPKNEGSNEGEVINNEKNQRRERRERPKKEQKAKQMIKIEPKKQQEKFPEADVDVQYKKQYKTRERRTVSVKDQQINGKSMEVDSKFSEYKKQLASLQDRDEGKNQIETDGRRRVQSESKQNFDFSSPISQKKGRVYKIGQDSIRKHSLKKSKQAENQMMANIEFLRSMRGVNNSSTPKKQWKQDHSQVRNTIQQIRQNKRQHLESLGFTDPASRLLQSKLGESELYSPQRSDILPEIKKSRKRGQVYKPAAFSVYTIQKDNEIFYNKFIK